MLLSSKNDLTQLCHLIGQSSNLSLTAAFWGKEQKLSLKQSFSHHHLGDVRPKIIEDIARAVRSHYSYSYGGNPETGLLPL
ncbi:Uncharacterised protein [Yersinia frederiksenii]|nr:Uncharacterised protein [Yersinia frederiksenii]